MLLITFCHEGIPIWNPIIMKSANASNLADNFWAPFADGIAAEGPLHGMVVHTRPTFAD